MRSRTWKRTVVALVLVAVVAGAAAAAGSEEAASAEPTRIIMQIPGPPQPDQQMVNEAVSEYLSDDLNIELDLQQTDFAAWVDRSNLIIASGEACDVLFTAGWTGYPTNAARGAFVDLTEMIPEIAPELLETDYAWTFDAARIDGRLYGVPTYQQLAQSRGFFLRKDLVDKYAPEGFTIDPVENDPRGLEPLFEAILENEPNMVPWYGVPGKMLRFMVPFDAQGRLEPISIDVTDAVPRFHNIFDSDYYREAMDLSREWFLKGYINKDAATTTESPQSVIAGGAAFAFSGQTNVGAAQTVSQSTGFEMVAYPVLRPIVGTGLVQGALFSIPRQSENPEVALEFIARMHTDKDLVNMLRYGIEDVHYVKVEENMIEPAPDVNTSSHPYLNLRWMFGNQALLYDYGEQGRGAAEALREFNENAVASPALGFSFDPEPVKTEMATLANVIGEYDPVIASGSVDAVEPSGGLYQEFLNKLESSGIQKVLDEANSQLDEWMEENR
jgi:putative aldouronate transport system substrate-binding protein